MSCSRLVCAACSGRVADGRCPVCRAARSHLHPVVEMRETALAVLALLVAALAMLLLAARTGFAL